MATPHKKLVEILQRSYCPCPEFEGACKGTAKWKPDCGQIPRGFVGALRSLEEVRIVIIMDRPSNPFPHERYTNVDQLEQTTRFAFQCYQDGTDREFHTNLTYFLNLVFPEYQNDLNSQLRKTWVTNSYLCSTPKHQGKRVPPDAWKACVDRYLARQLEFLGGKPVIAFGSLVGERARRAGVNVHLLKEAHAFTQRYPEQLRKARDTWEEAARWARAMS